MSASRRNALLGVFLGVLVFGAIAAGGILWHDFSRFSDSALAVPESGINITVKRGASFGQIIAQLQQHKLSAAPRWYWRLLAERMRVTDALHAGEYALAPGLTPRSLFQRLATGDVVQHQFTIVEGWRFAELRSALAADTGLVHVTGTLDAAGVMQRIDAAGENPEGRFLPETYAYVRGDSDLDVLTRAYAAMQSVLAAEWEKRASALPIESPYQALILASIIEKETGRSGERARIAGVFTRRLDIGMPLQTDPTVIYGMGKAYDGNIRRSDLARDTPYNTYLHVGLPPTPIALPGAAAIHAALHPAPGKALYFVANGQGGHVFSATLREHNRAVACYQLHRGC